MSLSSEQEAAFTTAAGGVSSASAFYGAISAILMGFVLLWAAWLLLNTYNAWVEKRVSFGGAGGVYIRVIMLILIMISFLVRFI